MTVSISRDEVHQALEALYDNVALGGCPLASHFARIAVIADLSERALRLRAVLLEAIERLRPSRRAAFGSRETRACDVLTLRYVERMSIAAMMEELALGRRQVFRDLTQAEEKLAQILSAWIGTPTPEKATAPSSDSLSSELALLASQPVQVSVREVLEEAMALVAPLMAKRAIALDCAYPAPDELVVADRAILKQVLVQLLSWAVQHSVRPLVKVTSTTANVSLSLSVLCWPDSPAHGSSTIEEIGQIADHAGIDVAIHESTGICEFIISLGRQQPTSVLVVEDNPGAVALYRRYLGAGNWQVTHVSEPRLTLEIARRARPDVVVLDIMMPKMDGWSVLQALRQHEETRALPVIMCSVVEDEELSRALGAAVCLKKPVSQADFLAALYRCLHRRFPSP
ncbi:MAG: response regulator [Anaerolineae bacterium]